MSLPKLQQYTVTWDDKTFILYAMDPDTARSNVRAPAHATVTVSQVSDSDLRKMIANIHGRAEGK